MGKAGKFVILAAVPCWAFLILLPRSAFLQRLSTDATLLGIRASRFPQLASHRDSRCTLADSWNHAIEPEAGAEQARFRASCKAIRSEAGLDLVDTPLGPFWLPARDLPALAEMLEEQHRDVYGVDSGGVRPGDVVLDCGANIGVFTRRALQAGAGVVVAIEPAPENLVCLRRNFSQEIGEGKVIVYPKGVWDKDEELQLTTSPDLASTADSVALNRGASGPRISLTTIDEMVAELKLPRVDSIKMDIEGAEGKALVGGRQTIARYHPRMSISLEHRPDDPQTIPAAMRQLWPDRSIECGPCRNEFGHIQPEVAFVR
jgi:FkbM family methyltransferase